MVLDKNEGGAEVSKPGSSASDPNAQQAATSRHVPAAHITARATSGHLVPLAKAQVSYYH